ncbi:PRC-barrel domain-containing protein [Salinarimonas sp.]|uniref:PRC-barrel domain-containing protein n=1 Tax=Salinarimonas sp. TaxID=2766526 RepID=UPI0032D97AB8
MLKRTSTIAIIAAMAAAPAMAQDTTTVDPVSQAGTLTAENVVSLEGWAYDDLYAGGMSAEEFIDEYDVYGAAGEDIGDVEDVIVGADGSILAVVAEIGGFIDIGDTHVAVPWGEIEMNAAEQAITIPVTEENVENYGLYGEGYAFREDVAATGSVGEEVVAGLDDAELGPRAYRVSEVIGDYVRIRDEDGETTDAAAADDAMMMGRPGYPGRAGYRDYGYVNDVIIADGRVQAVVVNPDLAYGRGYYAYPYYSPYNYGYGPYYDLPYGEDEVGAVEPFEYERMRGEM